MRIARRLSPAAILSVLPLLTGAGAAIAADHKADFVFNWRSAGTVLNLEEQHIMFQGNLGGLARPGPAAEGPLARPIVMMCAILADVGGPASGFCVGTDSDGDKLFMRSAGKTQPASAGDKGAIAVDAGTFTPFAGTGKFAGITGDLSFHANSFGFLPDGGFVGYTVVSGIYSVP